MACILFTYVIDSLKGYHRDLVQKEVDSLSGAQYGQQFLLATVP